ncbi:MAG TPA: hypothetical protein VLC48_00530 [Gemmatimonadota bacterium]|nr:hypothetical protein [Gemmatimonadota bacterium]
MKAIPALRHRHAIRSAFSCSTPVEPIDRALTLLAEGGFHFEPVDRCPAPCRFCDGVAARAA